MNSFFEAFFSEYDFSKKETAVCCPFPHKTQDAGLTYYETNPSAHVNLMKGVFHCKVCEQGYSELGFISKILGTSYESAVTISRLFKRNEDSYTWSSKHLTDERKKKCIELGISEEVIEELQLKTEFGNDIAFPVLMYDKLLDVRTYRPEDRSNKIKSRTGAINGLVIPFDLWKDTSLSKWTIICAGEKDMAVARSQGFNAITLTGGEKALPAFINPFKDRRIAICYDNDAPGISGAKSLASHLQPYAEVVKVVTGFHEVCKEPGEDITDFFVKYGKSKRDLQQYIIDAPIFTAEEAKEVIRKKVPLITLADASKTQYRGRLVQSNIQVTTMVDKDMEVPTTMIATKVSNSSGDPKYNTMDVGTKKTWELTDRTCQDILKLIDSNLTEHQIWEFRREIFKIPKMERDVSVAIPSTESVYVCNITDIFEVSTDETSMQSYLAYSIKNRLESGKKYTITYRLVPHPLKGQVNTVIILDAKEVNEAVNEFKINDEVKQHLNMFRELEGTVPERITKLTRMVKNFLNYDGYDQLIQAIDLSYHTPLEFNFGRFERVRGYLDTLIVAESRVGKSSTALTLQRLYNLGAFASLAGNSATISGLVGGSAKVGGTFQTKAGLIPMNHKGLIIFEELAKCNADVIKELTDIRSSNQVRIARVNGMLLLPAMVRMITLTNAKTVNKITKPISSYPFGVDVLLDLIGTPEDIARYDISLVMAEDGQKEISAEYMTPERSFEPVVYQDRIRWVWSRTNNDIKINEEVVNYIVDKCNELNKDFSCHIKIFGTESWKKIARLAVAVASYLVSTDDTYESIIVTKEHVDWAVSYMQRIYDNETFKLKQYVANERLYSEIDDNGVALLQEIYNKFTAALLQLEKIPSTNKQNLMAATALDNESYNKMMQRLVAGLFIQFDGFEIVPTTRFRKGMSMIDRAVNIARVGEANV